MTFYGYFAPILRIVIHSKRLTELCITLGLIEDR